MSEHCGRAEASHGQAGTGGMPGTGGGRTRGRAGGGGRGRQAGRDGAAGRTGGGGCCAGGGRTPSIWQSGRSSRPAWGAAASRSAIAGSASRCCNCEAADGGLRQPAQQPGDAARQPERLGPGRAGRAQAAARRRQRAGMDFCGEAGEALRRAAQPRPEQQHQRQGETQAHAAGGDGAAQPLDKMRQNGRPGREERRAA